MKKLIFSVLFFPLLSHGSLVSELFENYQGEYEFYNCLIDLKIVKENKDYIFQIFAQDMIRENEFEVSFRLNESEIAENLGNVLIVKDEYTLDGVNHLSAASFHFHFGKKELMKIDLLKTITPSSSAIAERITCNRTYNLNN